MPSITPSPSTGPNAAITAADENVSLSRNICWTSSCRYTMNIGSPSSCGSAPDISSRCTGSSRRSRASSVYGSRTSPEIASSKDPKSSRSSKSCSMSTPQSPQYFLAPYCAEPPAMPDASTRAAEEHARQAPSPSGPPSTATRRRASNPAWECPTRSETCDASLLPEEFGWSTTTSTHPVRHPGGETSRCPAAP